MNNNGYSIQRNVLLWCLAISSDNLQYFKTFFFEKIAQYVQINIVKKYIYLQNSFSNVSKAFIFVYKPLPMQNIPSFQKDRLQLL